MARFSIKCPSSIGDASSRPSGAGGHVASPSFGHGSSTILIDTGGDNGDNGDVDGRGRGFVAARGGPATGADRNLHPSRSLGLRTDVLQQPSRGQGAGERRRWLSGRALRGRGGRGREPAGAVLPMELSVEQVGPLHHLQNHSR
jgi:hypothetical protein